MLNDERACNCIGKGRKLKEIRREPKPPLRSLLFLQRKFCISRTQRLSIVGERPAMKRTITNLFLALGSLCIGAAGLQAQSYALSASVPFAFHANGANCSSGSYIFQKEVNREVQSLRNRDTGRSLYLGVAPQSKVNHGSPRLVFHRYGNEYFLS